MNTYFLQSQKKALAELASVTEARNFRDDSMRGSMERKSAGRSSYSDKQLYKSYDESKDNPISLITVQNLHTLYCFSG